MKNYEKYLEELIASLSLTGVSCVFIHKRVFGGEKHCGGRDCIRCNERFREWLDEEYIPSIDWSKVPVDTPVFVSNRDNHYVPRHFKEYREGYDVPFICFDSGLTSFTIKYDFQFASWNYCKLAREEDIEKYSI